MVAVVVVVVVGVGSMVLPCLHAVCVHFGRRGSHAIGIIVRSRERDITVVDLTAGVMGRMTRSGLEQEGEEESTVVVRSSTAVS